MIMEEPVALLSAANMATYRSPTLFIYFPNEEKVFICEPWTMKFFVGDDTQHIHTHVRTHTNV